MTIYMPFGQSPEWGQRSTFELRTVGGPMALAPQVTAGGQLCLVAKSTPRKAS